MERVRMFLEEHENVCRVAISLTLGEKERGDQEENFEQMARGSTEEETSLEKKKKILGSAQYALECNRNPAQSDLSKLNSYCKTSKKWM